MSDDLNAFCRVDRAMAVMKMEMNGLERVDHFDLPAQQSVVVAGDYDDVAALTQFSQELACFARRRFVMHEIAEDNEAFGRVLVDQCGQTV